MINYIFKSIFLISTIFITIKIIYYGLYEIKTLKNKSGGLAIIIFSSLTTILTNIIIFIK